MNITELDEWQGLTSAMVQQWAEDHGYQYRVSGLVKGGYVSFANPLRPDAIGWLVPLLADRTKLSPQAFLREINPRMRKGMPSQAALRAHRGLWLRSVGTESIATVLSRLIEEFPSSRDDGSFFWPCDDNGNKTRWPTDAEGNML